MYSIGDTLTLTSSFSKTLTDEVNNSPVDYSNSVGILSSLVVYELDTVQHQPIGAVAKFDYLPVLGSLTESSIVPTQKKAMIYYESPTTYNFQLKVVPRVKGIYAIYINSLVSDGIRGTKCTNAGFSNTLTNSNKNLNLFQYAINRPPASQYEIDRIYCFRVQ